MKFLNDAKAVFSEMEQQFDQLGGFRVESTIEAVTLNEAVELHNAETPWKLKPYLAPATLEVRCMNAIPFKELGRQLLTRVTNVLRQFGITNRHDLLRALNVEEKRVFGDIKSLLR